MNRTTVLIAIGATMVAGVTIFLVHRLTGVLRDLAPVKVRVSQVVEQDVAFPALTPDGKKLVYFGAGDGGQGIIRLDLATRTRELFRPLPQVSSMTWSPDRSRVILWLTYDEDTLRRSAPRFVDDRINPLATAAWLYDVERDRLEGLTEYVSSAVWSPAGDRILYHYINFTAPDPVSELSVKVPFETTYEKLIDVPPAPSYTLAFLDASTVMAVPNLSSPSGTSTIYLVNLLTKSVATKEEGNVSVVTASPDGRFLLFASAGDKPNWRLYDRSSDTFHNLKIEAFSQYGVWVDADTVAIVEPGGEKQDRLWLVEAKAFTRQEVILDDPSIHIESPPQVVGERVYFKARGKLFTFSLPRNRE